MRRMSPSSRGASRATASGAVPSSPPSRLALAMAVAATVAKRSRGAQRMARSMITVIAPPKPMPIRKRPSGEAGAALGNAEDQGAGERDQSERGCRAPDPEAIEGETHRHLSDRRGQHHGADHDPDLGAAEPEAAVQLARDHAATGAVDLGDDEESAGDGEHAHHGGAEGTPASPAASMAGTAADAVTTTIKALRARLPKGLSGFRTSSWSRPVASTIFSPGRTTQLLFDSLATFYTNARDLQRRSRQKSPSGSSMVDQGRWASGTRAVMRPAKKPPR